MGEVVEDSSVKFVASEPEMIEENGILVLQVGANRDINKLIEEDREERMNKLMSQIIEGGSLWQ